MRTEDLLKKARELGLDGIAVTDHNNLDGGRFAEGLSEKFGIRVFAAQEVSTVSGDVLAFGLSEDGLQGISVTELSKIAKQDGAVLIAAHPFRAFSNALGNELYEFGSCFQAVEGYNGNANRQENARAVKAARDLGLPVIGASDAHSVGEVGRFYTVFDGEINALGDLIEALKRGAFRASAESSNWGI